MIELSSTIHALATGPISSGGSRALLRITGPGVPHLCAALAPTLNTARPSASKTVLHLDSSPKAQSAPIELPALAIFAKAPHTFTGQDTLELLLPANQTLIDLILATLHHVAASHNASAEHSPLHLRPALPGEFAARAVILGKLDASQAEAIGALISAGNASELAAARAVLSGQLGAHYRAWADELATLLALVEAGIDFADSESVTAISTADLTRRAAGLTTAMHALLGAATGQRAPSPRLRIALAGRPNAGKSTLFNALLNRARAITSPLAGTTRDVLVEPLTLTRPGGRSITVDLIDLAGLDQSLDQALAQRSHSDAQALAAARRAIAAADIIVRCQAADDPSPPLDLPITNNPPPAIVTALTKADKPHDALEPTQSLTTAPPTIHICALDGRGLDSLQRTLFDLAWSLGHTHSSLDILPRHRDGLQSALAELTSLIPPAGLTAPATTPDERTAATLRSALDHLGQLTGQVDRDEILGRIYATFCIGK